MLTKDEASAILIALREVKASTTRNNNLLGICTLTYITMPVGLKTTTLTWMQIMCKHWPHWSGCVAYPVPCEGMAPDLAYSLARRKWNDDAYGDSRRALLDWYIMQCEKELECPVVFQTKNGSTSPSA